MGGIFIIKLFVDFTPGCISLSVGFCTCYSADEAAAAAAVATDEDVADGEDLDDDDERLHRNDRQK